MEKIIGKKEKRTNKGTDKPYVADSLIHDTTYHTQCLYQIPNFVYRGYNKRLQKHITMLSFCLCIYIRDYKSIKGILMCCLCILN